MNTGISDFADAYSDPELRRVKTRRLMDIPVGGRDLSPFGVGHMLLDPNQSHGRLQFLQHKTPRVPGARFNPYYPHHIKDAKTLNSADYPEKDPPCTEAQYTDFESSRYEMTNTDHLKMPKIEDDHFKHNTY